MPVHLLALVTAGRANFTVDFATYPCRPGGLLWVRPGQFVGFPPPGIDATLVLFEPQFPYERGAARRRRSPAARRAAPAGTYWQPTGEDEEAIVDGVSQLEIDYARIVAGDDIPLEVLRHQLAALLLRLRRLEPEGGPELAAADSEILARFRREVDAQFARTRQVEEYARALACSVRTLTRASLAATGRTAKQLRRRPGRAGGQAPAGRERPGRGRGRGPAGLHRADQLRPVLHPYRRGVAGPVPDREPRAAAGRGRPPTPPASPVAALAKAGAGTPAAGRATAPRGRHRPTRAPPGEAERRVPQGGNRQREHRRVPAELIRTAPAAGGTRRSRVPARGRRSPGQA